MFAFRMRGFRRAMRVWQLRLYTTTIFLFSDSDLCKVCGYLLKHQSFGNRTSYLWCVKGGRLVRIEPKA